MSFTISKQQPDRAAIVDGFLKSGKARLFVDRILQEHGVTDRSVPSVVRALEIHLRTMEERLGTAGAMSEDDAADLENDFHFVSAIRNDLRKAMS